jgi:hypothetical protein
MRCSPFFLNEIFSSNISLSNEVSPASPVSYPLPGFRLDSLPQFNGLHTFAAAQCFHAGSGGDGERKAAAFSIES